MLFYFSVLRIYAVEISVTDKNDENPKIINHPEPFQATVGSDAKINTRVYQLLAFDPDTTADIKFYLEGNKINVVHRYNNMVNEFSKMILHVSYRPSSFPIFPIFKILIF